VLFLEVLVLCAVPSQSPSCAQREEERTGNLSPYIEKLPVPSAFRKSPPVESIVSCVDWDSRDETRLGT
jgi:hypothetical protein